MLPLTLSNVTPNVIKCYPKIKEEESGVNRGLYYRHDKQNFAAVIAVVASLKKSLSCAIQGMSTSLQQEEINEPVPSLPMIQSLI